MGKEKRGEKKKGNLYASESNIKGMELKGQMGYLGFIIWKGREKVGN